MSGPDEYHEHKQDASVTMSRKMETTHPYNIFFTTIPKSISTVTQSNAITFTDLICPSLGNLACSLQINFMIDVMWLMEQYQKQNVQHLPLTLVCSDEFPRMKEFIDLCYPNVKVHFVKPKPQFGIHHSKIGIYRYMDNSIRVVVSTANLYYEDWNHYNQGLWISPLCPILQQTALHTDGESPTGFKKSLLNYLESYNEYNVTCLKEWIAYVKRANFSNVKVCLVTSVPGKHNRRPDANCHLHRMQQLLSRHCDLPRSDAPEWPIIAQSSSLGSMGKQPMDWLKGIVLRTLSATKTTTLGTPTAAINIIYPSVNNVAAGFWGLESGGCLPYSKQVNENQRWLQDFLHTWKADKLQRSRAMPHIKSYCRISPFGHQLAWFLLTSANISKAAWGSIPSKEGTIFVRSFEVGVLFLPHFFHPERNVFNLHATEEQPIFPIMYDWPLTPYKSDDYPWCN